MHTRARSFLSTNLHLPALLAVLMVTVTIACGGGPEASAPPLTAAPVTAKVAPVQRLSQSRTIEVYGVVQPRRQAAVSSRLMGPVASVAVDSGDTVRAGQVLLEIEPEVTDGQVAQARGGLAQAQAALALAQRNFDRFTALNQEGAASELELDMARTQHEQAEAAVNQAKGAVLAASTVAGDSTVKAPFAARVVERLVEVGDMAAPGRPLVRLESLTGHQIWLSVRADDIRYLHRGQGIEVRLDRRPEQGALAGTIDEIMPSADPATHTFTVKVGIAGVDEELASGISGQALIPGELRDHLLIPTSAVFRRGGLELVVVRAEDGTARTRAVTLGKEMANDMVEVLSGLAQGEQVLIDGPGPLADGTPVEVVS